MFKKFDELDIKTETWDHTPVFTTKESEFIYKKLSGGHCKSLFLTDKKKTGYWLVVALNKTQVDLKKLPEIIGSGRLSFVQPKRMQNMLGVTPGAVTPFALMNDTSQQIKVLLDSNLMSFEILNFHPLKNDKTTKILCDDLLKFIESSGHSTQIINCEQFFKKLGSEIFS